MNLKPSLIFEKTLSQETELKVLVEQMIISLGKKSILLLSGDLGAGKTTLIRHLCQHFGFQLAQSPTYAIHQQHSNNEITIDHFDLYRMTSKDDLVSTGFWDLVQEGEGLILIEWYEKMADFEWLEFESKKRQVFGLKIQIVAKKRVFSFNELR